MCANGPTASTLSWVPFYFLIPFCQPSAPTLFANGGGGGPLCKEGSEIMGLFSRALEELREVMSKDELKTFLTIHIREGASQVVLLFMDELPTFKLPWH